MKKSHAPVIAGSFRRTSYAYNIEAAVSQPGT